ARLPAHILAVDNDEWVISAAQLDLLPTEIRAVVLEFDPLDDHSAPSRRADSTSIASKARSSLSAPLRSSSKTFRSSISVTSCKSPCRSDGYCSALICSRIRC